MIIGSPEYTDWLRDLKKRGRRERTIWTYTDRLSLYDRWLTSRVLVPSIESAQVYLDWLSGEGRSPATVSLSAHAIKSYFEHAKVTGSLIAPPIRIHEAKYLSQDQVLDLIRNCRIPWVECIASVLYDSGARISEVLNLRFRDVDLKDGKIFVTRKGGRQEWARLSEDGVGAFVKWFKVLNAHPLSSRASVFPGVGYQDAWKYLKDAAKRAHIEKFTPHQLRHSRARHLLYEEGYPPEYVRDVLGHRNVSTTLDIYGRRKVENIRVPGWNKQKPKIKPVITGNGSNGPTNAS